MALDFYYAPITQEPEVLYSVDSSELAILENLFLRFKDASGMAIDPNGTTILSSANVKHLLSIASELSISVSDSTFIQFLKRIERDQKSIVCVGD